MEGQYIAWLGSVFDEATIMANVAASPAANRWEHGLITALQARGIHLVSLGHLPEPLWPKGRPWISAGTGRLAPGIKGQLVGYWNMPGLRGAALRRCYMEAFEQLCRTKGLPLVVMSYNNSPQNVAVGIYAQVKLGVPWISVIADLSYPGANWERFSRLTAQAAGHIFLSWGAYARAPLAPKLHLDGGIEQIRSSAGSPASTERPVVVYTGTMNRYGGVSFLVEGFHRVQKVDAQLWICGKGKNPDVERIAAIDSRVKVWGLVSEQRLAEVCQAATVFVNPRPSQIPDNRMNFPSKVLEYLSYGKPVISTWTDGLSPAYRDVLAVLDEETPECLARTIDGVLAWDPTRRSAQEARVRAFCESEKTWTVQADRLLEWMGKEVRICGSSSTESGR